MVSITSAAVARAGTANCAMAVACEGKKGAERCQKRCKRKCAENKRKEKKNKCAEEAPWARGPGLP